MNAEIQVRYEEHVIDRSQYQPDRYVTGRLNQSLYCAINVRQSTPFLDNARPSAVRLIALLHLREKTGTLASSLNG